MTAKSELLFSMRFATLGVINGFTFGVLAEAVRSWFVQTIWEAYERPTLLKVFGGAYPSELLVLPDPLTPLLCVLIFTPTCYLLHRYRKDAKTSNPLLWVMIGIVAVTLVVPYHRLSSDMSGDHLLNFWWKLGVSMMLVIPYNYGFGLAVNALSSTTAWFRRKKDRNI